MKTLRVWLLLLLAVLLPVRGALAVAMDCSGSMAQVQAHAQAQVSGPEHDHPAPGGGHGQHEWAGHGQPDDAAHEPLGASDKCKLCASSCSVPGPASVSMALAARRPVAAVFPPVQAPPASFFADGEERPPRTG